MMIFALVLIVVAVFWGPIVHIVRHRRLAEGAKTNKRVSALVLILWLAGLAAGFYGAVLLISS
jgi:formate-dependent nitrite reductase membrane component NrfD